MFMTFRLKGSTQNFLLPSGCVTEDDITSTDGLTYDDILMMG